MPTIGTPTTAREFSPVATREYQGGPLQLEWIEGNKR